MDLSAADASEMTYVSLAQFVADVSSDCCGIKLLFAVPSLDGDGSGGPSVRCNFEAAAAPVKDRKANNDNDDALFFLLPADLPKVLVAMSKKAVAMDDALGDRALGLDCPTVPSFDGCLMQWVAACSSFCSSVFLETSPADASAQRDQSSGGNFLSMLERADRLHAENPFLVGRTMTVVDVAVSLLVVGTATMLKYRGVLSDVVSLRGPFFHHCCDVLISLKKKPDKTPSATSGGNPCAILSSRRCCSFSQAILRLLHDGENGTVAGTRTKNDATLAQRATISRKKDRKDTGLPAQVYVLAFALLFFLMIGVEGGTMPSALKTMRSEFRTSTIGITAALQMKELGKIIVAPVAAHFAVGIRRKLLACIAAVIVWSAGVVVIGTSPTVLGVGAGSFISGFGFGAIFVIYSPFLVSRLPRAALHVLPTYVALILASAAFGVVVAYATSGATLDMWRLNFCLSPALAVISLAIFGVGIASSVPNSKTAEALGGCPVEQDGSADEEMANTEVAGEPAVSSNVRIVLPAAVLEPDVERTSERPREPGGHRDPVACKKDESTGAAYMTVVAMLLRQPFVLLTIVVHAAQTFCISSFAALLPLYIEDRMSVSRGTAAYVMAGTVPFLVAGTIVGGAWSQRKHFGLVQQLNMTWIASVVSTAMMPIFFIDTLLPFVVVLLVVMFIISLKAGPQTALLSNSCELIAIRDVLHQLQAKEGSSVGIPLSAAVDARHLSDRYIGAVSSIMTIAIRIFGTIPGPIVLSVLVDSSGWDIQYPFLLVGFASCGVMAAAAAMAYRMCPKDADTIVATFHAQCIQREMEEIFFLRNGGDPSSHQEASTDERSNVSGSLHV
jgi:MFS family permease